MRGGVAHRADRLVKRRRERDRLIGDVDTAHHRLAGGQEGELPAAVVARGEIGDAERGVVEQQAGRAPPQVRPSRSRAGVSRCPRAVSTGSATVSQSQARVSVIVSSRAITASMRSGSAARPMDGRTLRTASRKRSALVRTCSRVSRGSGTTVTPSAATTRASQRHRLVLTMTTASPGPG
jgi:hypothetical protein